MTVGGKVKRAGNRTSEETRIWIEGLCTSFTDKKMKKECNAAYV